MKTKTRVEVVKRTELPFKIIRDKDVEAIRPVRRIQLNEKALAQQLRIPRHQLLAYLKARLMHPTTAGEKESKHGLCSEELAALSVMGHLHGKKKMPMTSAADMCAHLICELLSAANGERVAVIILKNNQGGIGLQIRRGRGAITVDPVVAKNLTIFDVTMLAHQIEKRLDKVPLKLPITADCAIPIPPYKP